MSPILALILILVPLVLRLNGVRWALTCLTLAIVMALWVGAFTLVVRLPPAVADRLLGIAGLDPIGHDRAYHDTYYVVAHVQYLLLPALVFALMAGAAFLAERRGPLALPRITAAGVCTTLLQMIAALLVPVILWARAMPRRYLDDIDAILTYQTIQTVLAAGFLALAGLTVGLFLWQALARRAA